MFIKAYYKRIYRYGYSNKKKNNKYKVQLLNILNNIYDISQLTP